MITGEAALTKDLISTSAVDFKVTNYISVAAIFLIVAAVFQSLTVPLVLVSTIELAIFINQGVPYFTGTTVPFVAPTIIGCVQLGATVDYAILMLLFLFLEENGVMAGMNLKQRILAALFQSVTPRTAGFNTVDIASLSDGSKFITMGDAVLNAQRTIRAGFHTVAKAQTAEGTLTGSAKKQLCRGAAFNTVVIHLG